ncbi:serpin family protein [Myxococcota bacterium]|nr:serpin family protein [Myxococcota bacterium]MBU1536104.1 serpin family protein [Myxococcota bacterium]
MRRVTSLLMALFMLLGLASGCDDDAVNYDWVEYKSSLPRDQGDLSDPAVVAQVSANNDFAVSMYLQLAAEAGGKDIIFSPASIVWAMAMVYGGADGDLVPDLTDVFGFPAQPEGPHPALNILDQHFDSINSSNLKLTLVNRTFVAEQVTPEQPYLDLLAQYYGTGMYSLPFLSDAQGATDTINQWVSDNTGGLIPELYAEPLDVSTKSVLVNAIYFKGKWVTSFDKSKTAPGFFMLRDGSGTQVELMRAEGITLKYMDDGVQTIASLPYKGDDTEMIIVMPAAGTFDTFELGLTATDLNIYALGLDAAAPHHDVTLVMPKFTAETRANLVDMLISMGVEALSTNNYSLTPMLGQAYADSLINRVLHAAVIKVDESGTEAAAATGVDVNNSMPPSLHITSPFIYFIREKTSGSILFMGRFTGE